MSRGGRRVIGDVEGGSIAALRCRRGKKEAAAPCAGYRRWLDGELAVPAVELRRIVDRANLDHEITMKYYFNNYLISKLKDIIKILLFNENKLFWEDFPRF